MKKPFSILLSLTLTASTFVSTVFAAPVIDKPELNDDTGIVSVSGSVSDGRYGDPVTIYVVNDNYTTDNAEWSDTYFINNIKAYKQTTLDNNLSYSEEIGFGGYASGDFDIYVSANGETVKYDFFFADKQSKVNFIKGTPETDDELGVAEIICQDGKTDSTLIGELKSKLSLTSAQSVTAKTFNITEQSIIFEVDADNFTAILFSILKEKENEDAGSVESLQPAEFVEIMELAASIEKINDGSESVITYQNIFELDEAFVKTYTKCAIDGTDFINYTKDNGLKSVEDVQECFKESVVTYLIVNADGWSDYIELIDAHGDYIGINMKKYNSLDNNEKITDYLSTYETMADFAKAVNKAIDKVDDAESKPKRGGGGGGGGTISSVPKTEISGDITTPPVSLDKTEPKSVFVDVSAEHWGYEAIKYLMEKGVVSGVGDGYFAPDRVVTREEFVKILVLGLGITPKNTDSGFVDLNSEEWYNRYITAAVEAGIVKGISDKEFGLGLPVSRQDAATMIFRAAKLEKTDNTEPFVDDGDIAAYAKDGVYTLKQMGIVNGVGNGNFEPLTPCTRAQSAKMIYEYITKGD